MTLHQTRTAPSRRVPPAARQPGPVTLAIRGVRPNSLPSWEMREEQLADERRALRALRGRIKAQIDADLARVDRCLNALELMDGDADLEPSLGEGDDRERDSGDEAELCDETEDTLGWAANVGQAALGPNTADGDATALESHGAGFRRSGHEDDEDGYDREHDEAERGIGDYDGQIEQGFGIADGVFA